MYIVHIFFVTPHFDTLPQVTDLFNIFNVQFLCTTSCIVLSCFLAKYMTLVDKHRPLVFSSPTNYSIFTFILLISANLEGQRLNLLFAIFGIADIQSTLIYLFFLLAATFA